MLQSSKVGRLQPNGGTSFVQSRRLSDRAHRRPESLAPGGRRGEKVRQHQAHTNEASIVWSNYSAKDWMFIRPLKRRRLAGISRPINGERYFATKPIRRLASELYSTRRQEINKFMKTSLQCRAEAGCSEVVQRGLLTGANGRHSPQILNVEKSAGAQPPTLRRQGDRLIVLSEAPSLLRQFDVSVLSTYAENPSPRARGVFTIEPPPTTIGVMS